jgi:hypothetical protein
MSTKSKHTTQADVLEASAEPGEMAYDRFAHPVEEQRKAEFYAAACEILKPFGYLVVWQGYGGISG